MKKNSHPLYRIRQAKKQDMSYIISLAKKEGWNPGLKDGDAFFTADPHGFFIGELDHIPISCISCVRYQNFGFVGLYIVEENYRGNGYGLSLWEKAMDQLSDCNIGLDGVVSQQENYRKSGFTLFHKNMRFKYENTTPITFNSHPSIFNTQTLDFSELLDYDSAHFPSNRKDFLYYWLNMKNASSFAYLHDSKIQGYGTIRQCDHGYKIGPLFANTSEIAEVLFLTLIHFANHEPVYLDISDNNAYALALTKKYNMSVVFETARMYTKKEPPMLWDEIYGITSFELG
jgi:N-acetylglutamate synthase-like GNAT family acetyltransferase